MPAVSCAIVRASPRLRRRSMTRDALTSRLMSGSCALRPTIWASRACGGVREDPACDRLPNQAANLLAAGGPPNARARALPLRRHLQGTFPARAWLNCGAVGLINRRLHRHCPLALNGWENTQGPDNLCQGLVVLGKTY